VANECVLARTTMVIGSAQQAVERRLWGSNRTHLTCVSVGIVLPAMCRMWFAGATWSSHQWEAFACAGAQQGPHLHLPAAPYHIGVCGSDTIY
jgi:hypothetical protein